jgi:hypothetical protein
MTPHAAAPLLHWPARSRRAATVAALVLLTIATRWLAAPFQRGSYEYQYDGLLDTCVKPWQFFTGQAVAGGDNCYLSFATTYFASAAFGYRVEVLQAVEIAAAATCYGIVFLALDRMLGWASAVRTVLLLIVTLPFISHSVLPTNMHTALWGFSGVLYALTMQPSLRRDLVLASFSTLALFGYAAGVVTLAPLVLGHIALFRSAWPLRRIASAAVLAAAGVGLVAATRRAFTGSGDLSRWAIDEIGLPSFAEYATTFKIILRDLFVSADTWYGLGYGYPYLSVPVVVLLVAAAACSLLRSSGAQIDDGRQRDDRNDVTTVRARWIWLFLMTSLLASAIVSINPRFPGVRRVFPAAILMLAVAASAPALVPRARFLPLLFNAIFVVAVGSASVTSWVAIRHLWETPPESLWTVLSNSIAKRLESVETPHVVAVDTTLEPSLDRVLCGLHMDRRTRKKIAAMVGYSGSGDAGLHIWRNGDRSAAIDISDLPPAPVLVVSGTRAGAELLSNAVERTGPASSRPTVTLVIAR